MEDFNNIKIRALTYHLPLPSKETQLNNYLESALPFNFEKLRNIFRTKSKLDILTRRIVFPYFEEIEALFDIRIEKFIEYVYEKYGERKDIDYIGIPLSEFKKEYMDKIPEMFLTYPKLFISIKYDPNNIPINIELLRNISSKSGWINATHFAFSFGNQLVTPYFPASISKGKGITISLLYPNYILKESEKDNNIIDPLVKAARFILNISSSTLNEFSIAGKFLGIDYSLSPWKDESIAKLLEKINNKLTFSLPGTLSSIFQTNLALLKVATNYKGIGYNEIMLPLAEDNYLKELVRNNEITFSDFVSLISVCVAGLDMIPIPSWTDSRILEGIFKDIHSLSLHKGKTLGLRLILADAEPEEEIDLGMFGYTPVLDPLS